MTSGGDSASINVICDTDGNVQYQTLARPASDDWGSSDSSAPSESVTADAPIRVGKPLIKSYWFDHLDCDHRELLQLLRKAGTGVADRARVWMRMDEHQLIRAELTATPLTDETGQTRSVLVRTEPTYVAKRKRDLGEPITKPLTVAEPTANDLLQVRLSVPMIRVEGEAGTILGINDACADLLGRNREEMVGLPLSEFVVESDRRPLIEVLAAESSDSIRTLDLQLIGPSAQPLHARLSVSPEPGTDRRSIVVIRDLSTEQVTQDLLRRADAMTSVMLRSAERLQLLESFFDRAPLGLALYDRGQLLRSNRAFEARQDESLRKQIDSLVNSEAIGGVVTSGAIAFRAGEQSESPLAIITGHEKNSPVVPDAIAQIVHTNGSLAIISVAEDESLTIHSGSIASPSDSQPVTLAELLADEAIADVRSAIQVARTGQFVDPLDVALAGERRARISFAQQSAGDALLLIDDVTPLRSEIDRLAAQLHQQADSIAELSARASSIDPDQFAGAVSLAADREAQLSTLVHSLNAGRFTWDIDRGTVDADARAIELLGNAAQPLTAATLLSAATLDERRTFEQRYFDAVSGDRRVDLRVHIGPDRRPVRLLGHVIVDEKDGSSDPRTFAGMVVDLAESQTGSTRVAELEQQLAVRTAELNAILESSRDAIRIVSNGTLRHNSAAGELFSDDINAFLDANQSAATNTGDRPIQSSSTPIIVNGQTFGVVSVASDQSDNTQLQRREAEVAAIFANTGVAIALLDEQRQFRDVNSALCALIGYARTQLIGRPIAEFVHPDDQSTLAGEFDAVNSNELQSCTSDLRLLRREHGSQWVHLTVTRPRDASTHETIVLAQDIQELRELRIQRDQLRGDLEQSHSQHQSLTATMQDAFLRLSANGQILDANPAARSLFALDGRSSLSHVSFIAPETGNAVRDPLPWTRATPDRPVTIELRVVKPNEDAFVGRFSARADEVGSILLTVTDVTRIHAMQEELQKAYARIVESHTLLQSRTRQLEGNFVSAVQQLGASISSAHGTAKALRGDSRLPKPLYDLAARIVDAFRVHRRLVQHYTASATASRSPAAEDLVDVHTLANDAVQALAERFNITGRLDVSLTAAQHRSRLDGAMVRHALWSIFAHAVSQATKTAARVSSSSLTSTRGDGKLRLTVEWPGTRAGTAELTLADALISSCGGSFELNTTANMTTAVIEFDLDASDSDASPSSQPEKRHVLLVEDHESTARVLRRQLERLNCVVSVAGNLAAARSVIDDRNDVDVVICDLSLPDDDLDASLRELLRRIDIPAIALRSYGGAEAPEDLLAMGFVDHIDKPVDLNALSTAIARFAATAGE